MDDKRRLLKLADQIQAVIREGDLDRAVGLLEDFLEMEGADRIWGLGLLQTVLGRMRENGVDEETAAVLLEQEEAIRRSLLSMAEGSGPWMHRWELARQQNNQAWQDLAAARSKKDIEAALASAERSLQFWPYFLPHQDTRVRCLLALGRDHEAFACVRWVEAIQPDWPDFVDIRADRRYRRWLSAHQTDPVELPAGQATQVEVLPRFDPRRRSSADQPLNAAERLHLRGVRCGRDEWHRARNAALIAVILDGDLPVGELLSMGPQAADLTRGVYCSDAGELNIGSDSLAKLRHWLIYGSTNHPLSHKPGAPAGIRARLFVEWSLKGMTRRGVEALLAEIGQKVGIEGLDLWRCRPEKVAGCEKRTGFIRRPVGKS